MIISWITELSSRLMLAGSGCRAQVLLAASQSHLLSEKKFAVVLIPRLCNTILAAPSSARHVSLLPYCPSSQVHWACA